MNVAYVWMLNCYRRGLSWKRIVARLLPAGTSEILGVFEHFNFLRLIPTFLAVIMVPEHFFRRFDPIVKGKSLLFSSPAQCVVQFATVLTCFRFFPAITGKSIQPDEKDLVVGLLVIGLSCPVWSMGLLLILRYMLSTVSLGILGMFISDKLDWFWVDRAFKMFWSINAFRRLNWAKYLQGQVLFATYCCVAIPLAIVPTVPLIWLNGAMHHWKDITGEPASDTFSPYVALMIRLLLAYCGSWLILRPLAYLFVYCSRYPGEAALRFETLRIQRMTNKIFFRSRSRNVRPDKLALDDVAKIKQEVGLLLARWKLAENRVRTSPEHLQDLLKQRQNVSADMLQFRLYIDRKDDITLSTSLDRIEGGLPLG